MFSGFRVLVCGFTDSLWFEVLYCGFTDVLWFLRAVFYACSLMFSAFWVLFDLCSFFYWYCRLREFSEVLRFLGAVYVLSSLGTIVYESLLMLIIIIMDISMAHGP